jgi:pSer/pThr/pTyr-binding forkhead associated (FHA) protein
MLQCPFCHTDNPEGTTFCPECGTYLLEDDRRGTDVLLDNLPDEIEAPLLSQEGSLLVIRLSISGKGRQVILPLEKPAFLGRSDPLNHIFPEVDLSEDDGPPYGVSRRHAKIFKRGAAVLIEDLGSLNGTLLNNRRLMPHMPEPLAHGDTLELGRLVIQVLFDDEDEIEKPQEITLQARRAYLNQRVEDLFELYEGGLCYLEWIPPGGTGEPKSITRLIGEMLPLPHLGATLIGRYPDTALQLSSRKVSGHHCRVFYADFQFFIEDLGSTNGTYLSKTKLAPHVRQELQHGDRIRVGDIHLFFRNRLMAFLAELKLPSEQQMVIESIDRCAPQNFEAAIYMLGKLLHVWLDNAEKSTLDSTILLIYNLFKDTPLRGIDLLLKVTNPGKRRTYDRVYWALSSFLTHETKIMVEGLQLMIHSAGEHPLALLHWISHATPPGPFRNFFEVCEDLFSQGEYTQPDLERLISALPYLAEGVEAKNRLPLYQTFFKMLTFKTISEIGAFSSPSWTEEANSLPVKVASWLQRLEKTASEMGVFSLFPEVEEANPPPTGVVQWLQRLRKIAQVAQQAASTSQNKAKLNYLSQALSSLNRLKQETTGEPQKPELTLYSEILFRWRWIILAERDQLRKLP